MHCVSRTVLAFSGVKRRMPTAPERRLPKIADATRHSSSTGSQEGRFLRRPLKTDFHDASVVTLYLLPEVNLRLRPRLLQQLKTGARIVSHSFDMGDWKPDKQVEISGRTLYLWIVTDQAKAEFADSKP